jgi:hypothetical protein
MDPLIILKVIIEQIGMEDWEEARFKVEKR